MLGSALDLLVLIRNRDSSVNVVTILWAGISGVRLRLLQERLWGSPTPLHLGGYWGLVARTGTALPYYLLIGGPQPDAGI